MNAYELASQVEMWGKDLLALNMAGGVPCIEGATMLRQQATTLEKYEKAIAVNFEKIKQQADRIAELEKQYKFGVDWGKNDKSVTVLKICDDGVAEIVFFDYQERTHPVKQLSDEEIVLMYYHPDFRYEDGMLNYMKFARAIIKECCGIIEDSK